MPLGREAGLGSSDIMLDRGPNSPPQKETEPPIFSPCLLWPSGWMHQDATARWGPRPPPPKKGAQPSIFRPSLLWPNAKWIKMPLGREVGLGSGDNVLDGTRLHPLQKRGHSPQIFGPCLLWPNGWIHQYTIGTEVGLGPGDIVLDGYPAPLKGAQPPIFGPCLMRPNGCHLSYC